MTNEEREKVRDETLNKVFHLLGKTRELQSDYLAAGAHSGGLLALGRVIVELSDLRNELLMDNEWFIPGCGEKEGQWTTIRS